MWLNRLFGDGAIDIAKRCRTRMKVGAGFVILGAITMGGMVFVSKSGLSVPRLEADSREYLAGYYTTLGMALMAAGAAMIIKNARYLRKPELLKKREVAENDERNRLLGLRCWAYAGYAMFLILYVGTLVSGFISMTALMVLQMVIGAYALTLLFFKALLSRCM